MVGLTALWLPILLSAVIVFIASSIIHMALQIHRSDWGQLPHEAELLEALREAGVSRGQYVFPHAPSAKEMGSPEMKAKYEKGPMGFMIVMPPGMPAMGKNLALWFVYCIVIGIFVAYLTGRTLGPGTDYLEVFRVAGTAAILGYAGAEPIRSIWFAHTWSSTLKSVLDGAIYGLLTAGTFGWLWPS